MRISWQRVKAGMWLEFERRYRAFNESTRASSEPKARWLLRDLDDRDAGYTVSIWGSEESMLGYPSPALRAQIEATFADLLTVDPKMPPQSFAVRLELP
jgi:hypothetical protein